MPTSVRLSATVDREPELARQTSTHESQRCPPGTSTDWIAADETEAGMFDLQRAKSKIDFRALICTSRRLTRVAEQYVQKLGGSQDGDDVLMLGGNWLSPYVTNRPI